MDEKKLIEQIEIQRNFMKSGFGNVSYVSDQAKGLPQPPLVKAGGDTKRISLPKDFETVLIQNDYLSLLEERESERFYSEKPMTLLQLSFLLWSTQGIKAVRGKGYATLRPVPSAGGRHPFETYLAVVNVEGLESGLYHYLPFEHQLELLSIEATKLTDLVVAAVRGQKWAGKAAVTFFYSTVAYRCEWRYSISSHRVMLLDAGHIVQNLYLSAKAIGCGTCAIAALNQEQADELFKLDGKEEFIIYAAPVGVSDKDYNRNKTNELYAKI